MFLLQDKQQSNDLTKLSRFNYNNEAMKRNSNLEKPKRSRGWCKRLVIER